MLCALFPILPASRDRNLRQHLAFLMRWTYRFDRMKGFVVDIINIMKKGFVVNINIFVNRLKSAQPRRAAHGTVNRASLFAPHINTILVHVIATGCPTPNKLLPTFFKIFKTYGALRIFIDRFAHPFTNTGRLFSFLTRRI